MSSLSFLTVTNVIAAPAGHRSTQAAWSTVDLLFATVAPTDVYTITIATVVETAYRPRRPGAPTSST